MSIANYITRKKQSEIDRAVDEIQLITGKTYPEDNVIEIIKSFIPDVLIVEDDFHGDVSIRGVIYKKSEAFANSLIAIQKKQSKEGKNFALAHEFGHYCLGHTGAANYMIDKIEFDGSEEMQKEAEAQYFAATLLMPREQFIKLMHLLGIKDLALRFGVSESAVKVRKAWLDGSGREATAAA